MVGMAASNDWRVRGIRIRSLYHGCEDDLSVREECEGVITDA